MSFLLAIQAARQTGFYERAQPDVGQQNVQILGFRFGATGFYYLVAQRLTAAFPACCQVRIGVRQRVHRIQISHLK